ITSCDLMDDLPASQERHTAYSRSASISPLVKQIFSATRCGCRSSIRAMQLISDLQRQKKQSSPIRTFRTRIATAATDRDSRHGWKHRHSTQHHADPDEPAAV